MESTTKTSNRLNEYLWNVDTFVFRNILMLDISNECARFADELNKSYD